MGAGVGVSGSTYLVIVQDSEQAKDKGSATNKMPSQSTAPTHKTVGSHLVSSEQTSNQQGINRNSDNNKVSSVPTTVAKKGIDRSSAGRDRVAQFFVTVRSALGDPPSGFVGDGAPKPPMGYPLTPREEMLETRQQRVATISGSSQSVARAQYTEGQDPHVN